MLLFLSVSGCWNPSAPQTTVTGQTMGTSYTVRVVGDPKTIPDQSRLKTIIDAELDAVDRAMSTYRDDSELSRFNASESTDWFDVSRETAQVVDDSLRIGRLSGGAFDVTVEPLVQLWNFGPDASPDDAVPTDEQIVQCLASVGQKHLAVRLDPPAVKKSLPKLQIDLSSIAKGHAVDRVAQRLDREGIRNYMIEVGGEIRTHGHNRNGKAWQIAIERPVDGPRQARCILGLTNRAMATSGDYRNYFERDGRRYSHLIDPRTGRPITHRAASVTVLDDRCTEADALATTLAVLGPEAGLKLAEDQKIAAAFLVFEDGAFTEHHSTTFPSTTAVTENR